MCSEKMLVCMCSSEILECKECASSKHPLKVNYEKDCFKHKSSVTASSLDESAVLIHREEGLQTMRLISS